MRRPSSISSHEEEDVDAAALCASTGNLTVDSWGIYNEDVDNGSSGDESNSRRDSMSVSELGFGGGVDNFQTLLNTVPKIATDDVNIINPTGSYPTPVFIDSEINMPRSSAPTYADGEYEDDKAEMITKLMANHSGFVTSSLVERSNLITRVTCLSRHVPGCVLKSLFEPIMKARRNNGGRGSRADDENHYDDDYDDETKRSHSYSISNPPFIVEDTLPLTHSHHGALLFVDISGFTQLSLVMDVESLSNAINSYFERIVNEIKSHGGDILKFAGDALFAEWKVSRHTPFTNLDYCVSIAATCAASIVASCSDYVVLKALEFVTQSTRTRRKNSLHSSLISIPTNDLELSERSSLVDSLDYDSSLPSVTQSTRTRRKNSLHSSLISIPTNDLELSERSSLVDSLDYDSSLPSRRASLEVSERSDSGETFDCETPSSRLTRRCSTPRNRLRTSLTSASSDIAATLNVKCAIGVGQIVGIHVGDNVSRREYFIIGDTIGQVARAESTAGMGQAYASPEAAQHLLRVGELRGDWEAAIADGQPIRIADRSERFFEIERGHQISEVPCDVDNMIQLFEGLNFSELQWLRKMLSLYVHPVVVNEDNERASTSTNIGSFRVEHLTEAELRNVYTCFISPRIDHKLTGDDSIDQKLFQLLNDIMIVTTRELSKAQGHLRQFMLDDKGLVLICTFGLRGSTFPDMMAQRALPFSLAIHRALEVDLGVKNTVGATLGKVYCGVVGSLKRHEFAVLGPSVNLAARLNFSKQNPGIIVDETARLVTGQLFFKPLPAVVAKGYDKPVPIFEPIRQVVSQSDSGGQQTKQKFVGRTSELEHILRIAKETIMHGSISKLLLVTAISGSGKSTFMSRATELVRGMVKRMNRRVIITGTVSNEGDSIIPFSFFRLILKGVLSQVQYEDEEFKGENESIGDDESQSQLNMSSRSLSSRGSLKSCEWTRFRLICQDLNVQPDLMELVGKRFLGISNRSKNESDAQLQLEPNSTVQIENIVEFMVNAFIRCTMHADLVLLSLDDVQWMDESSWKVVKRIFERANNLLIFSGSRMPSTNLTMDPIFLSDLLTQHQTAGRYYEMSLPPFNEAEVKEFIAVTLNSSIDEVDDSFSNSVWTTSGGMPLYLSHVLDAIQRNNLTVRLDNGMIGMKSTDEDDRKMFGSVNELLLYRLDALDSSVRVVLHLLAILGTEFDLLDAAYAYEEMLGIDMSNQYEAAANFRHSLDVAVREGILESISVAEDRDKDDTIDASIGHPLFSENCRLRFTHDSWKKSILNVMLDEKKREIHEHVAISMERELDDETDVHEDFEKQITVFNHWKSSGSFIKAARMSLNIGGQLMMLGLNSQAVLLFDEVLDILRRVSDDESNMPTYGEIDALVLDAIDVPELVHLIEVNIAKGKAHLTLSQGVDAADAYQNALDILDYAPCAYDEEFDRSVSFPIFSGLFVALKMGAIKDDAECSFEKSMCKSFVEQARLNGDPVHYGRALAMEAEILGRLGNFEDALEIVERIKPIYNIKTQHETICKAYGSDRVAQAFSHSVNVYTALGRNEEALNTCKYIMEEIIPFSDPKNVHNSFCLLYSVIISLKENGLSQRAQAVFQKRIITPFEEYFGPGGSTFSKPLFRPISVLLELQIQKEPVIETIEEYTTWALDENFSETSISAQEAAFANFSATPFALLSEICFSLGKIHHDIEKKYRLIQKAISWMEKSDESTRCIAYPNMYAKKKLDIMKTYLDEMSSAGDIYSAMTSQEWTNLGYAESELVAATDDRKLINVRAAILLEHHLDLLLKSRNPNAKVTEVTKAQLVKFVDVLSHSYKGAKFHSYSHVIHVTTSMNKLISFTEIRDPMISFTLVFSALFHDAGHTGMSNKILCDISHALCEKYSMDVSIAERFSIDICLSLLFKPEYTSLRESIAPEEIDIIQFAKTFFMCILVTDIASPKSVEQSIARFQLCEEQASIFPSFDDLCVISKYINHLFDLVGLDTDVITRYPDEFTVSLDRLEVCVRNEHMMLLSDISHLLQGWANFVKWNFRLYMELHDCFKKGLCVDPKVWWYQGQIDFTDKYIIPLCIRSKRFFREDFTDQLLNNCLVNRNIWVEHGELATEIIYTAANDGEEESHVLQRLLELAV